MKYNNRYIFGISFISALGGYLFGFDFAVISGALPFLQRQFNLNSYWEGFATGILAIGAIFGCLFAGKVSNKYGRRLGLIISASIFLFSSLAMAFSTSRDFFLFFRFASGISVGMTSMLSPMYIAEISPTNIRGRLVAINQLTIVLGILFTNIINYFLRNNGDNSWRWMFGLGVIPSGFFLLGTLFLPESPFWLIQTGNKTKAISVLNTLGDDSYVLNFLNKHECSFNKNKKSNFYILLHKSFLPSISIGIFLAIFQQFCGINIVFNYAPKIFESIGSTKDNQLLQTVFIGGVNLLFTLLAMLLIDTVGRKPLMLIGSIGLSILYVLIGKMLTTGSIWLSWLLLSSIGLYAMSLGPVTWVLISEIYPAKIRVTAVSFSVIILWLSYFVLVFTFPVFFEKWKQNTFYIYSCICIIGFFIVFLKVKETKGKSLEDASYKNLGH